MEPVTHMLTGAVLARTGFNRRAAHATLAMAIAAEFPDIDTVWRAAGPITGLEHHRGITHTFLGVPFEAALIVAGFYAFHRLRKRPPTKAPANWMLLYGGVLLALLSHLLLDWTNNYGIRPFFPFDPRWYAGSFVFIFEPVLFALLVAGVVLPGLFALINAEVGAKKRGFASPGWAWVTLVLVGALYVFRYDEHAKALRLAGQNAAPDAARLFASPHPIDPFAWSTVAETREAFQLSSVNTRTDETSVLRPADMLYKPETSLALLAAKRTYLGKIYLDWSMYPVLSETVDNSDPHHPLAVVTFSDARFMYDAGPMKGSEHPPLSGSVVLDMEAPEGQRVVEMKLDGTVQK